MAISKILSTDKLQTGFRAKYNGTVDEIWVEIDDTGNGIFEITKFDGSKVSFALTTSFYTKEEILSMLSGNNPATEESAGIVEIATIEEVDAGEDDGKVITPYKANLSTLLPFKGDWKADFNEQDQPETSGYSQGMVVVHNNVIYRSDDYFNIKEPGTENSDWTAIGGSGPKTLIKNNGDIIAGPDDAYYYIDLDADISIVGSYPVITVYVNGVQNNQIWYDDSNHYLMGFDADSDNIVIKII